MMPEDATKTPKEVSRPPFWDDLQRSKVDFWKILNRCCSDIGKSLEQIGKNLQSNGLLELTFAIKPA